MLQINKDYKQLKSLRQLRLTPTSTSERYDLREFILNSSEAFFREINHKLFVVGSNVRPSEAAQVETDFLALDENGNAVVIVIEREGEASPLVRAITCAGLLSAWSSTDFMQLLTVDGVTALGQFLQTDHSAINQKQRVIFIAETYDFEALTATTWLASRGIDIFCVRVSRANGFQTDGEYLWCSHVSTPESAQQPLMMREGAGGFEVRVGDSAEESELTAHKLAAEADRRKQLEQDLRANGCQTDGEYLWCSHVSTPESAQQPLMMREGAGGFEVRVGDSAEESELTAHKLAAEADRRKQLEQDLRASEERYWTLAKLSPVGIFHTDAQGSLTYVNDRWCGMAGLSPQEAQGQGWARGLHSDDRDRVLNNWQETIDQGLPFKAEFRFQRADGGTSWVLGEAAVQKDESGKVSGYVGTVTELHRVDAARGGSLAAGTRR